MKKKFSIVLASIMLVCTLAIVLVACAPKDPEPYAAASNAEALEQIWEAWAKENMNLTGNTLGIDTNINLKNSDTDLSIALQGGITQDTNTKEVLRLAIANNKKSGSNKNIIDIMINGSDGLFVNIDGLSSKPIKISELKLPNIGDLLGNGGLGMSLKISDLLTVIKPAVVSLFEMSLDGDVTIDPVLADKKNKLYDVKYTFSVSVNAIVEAILDIIGTEGITPEVQGVLDEVVNIVSGINLDITVNTTGNTQEKVKKPAKGAPKYNYVGGKCTDVKIDVEGMQVDATGIKFGNSIPNISIPTDTMDLDTALLTSRINGNIDLKDSNGNVRSHYTYTINLDFTPIQLITTISDCIASGSATPILNKMFKEQEGKIFIEVNHTCGETCQTKHVGGKKMDGSIIAIAYSPKDFENNRVYVSLDLQTIINDSLLSDVIGIGLNSLFPSYYTSFSFDFLDYIDLVDLRAKTPTTPSEPGETTPGGDDTTNESNVFPVDKIVSLIGDMIPNVINGLKNDQELQLEIDVVRDILDVLYDSATLDDGTYWTILKAVNSLFSGVDKIAIDAEYTNGAHYDMNVLDLYKRQNDSVMKNFCDPDASDDWANHKVIKGEVTDWDKDNAGNVKIYNGGSKAGDYSNDLNSTIYNSDGTYKTMSYGELMELVVDKYATNTKNTVVIRFKDINGDAVESRMNIIEIAGLNPNVYTPQEVSLVLSTGPQANKSAGIGSSINNVIGAVGGLAGLVPQLSMIKELTTPEVILKTTIQIAEVTSVEWNQSKVNGITSAQIFDEVKTYANGDALSDTEHLTVTFANGTIHEADVKASNTGNFVKSNKITAWGTFDMNFSAFGYSKTVTVKMNDELGVDNQTVSLLLDNGEITYKIAKSIKSNVTNANVSFDEGETNAAISEFTETNGFKYESTSNFLGWTGTNITFNKKGTYTLSLKGTNNAVINLTFIIIENHFDENLYLGMSKTYNGKFGDYAFTKTEAEKAAGLNNNTNMTITVGGTDAEPTIKVEFKKTGKYAMTIVDKNNEYVIVNWNVTEAAKIVDKLVLNEQHSIKLKEQFADITFEKEVIEAAVTALNTANTGKITMEFNGDMADPTLTFTAIDSNGSSGYVLNMVGTQGEKAKLTIKHNIKSLSKTGSVGGNNVVVTAEEIGVPFTKEFVERLANTQNTGSNKNKWTVNVVDNEGMISLEFILLQPGSYKFTLTNKCEINITSNYEVNVNATVGTTLVLQKGAEAGQLNHSYTKYNFTNPVNTFKTEYDGKATLDFNDSTLALTFNFTEAGEYKLVVLNMTIIITVTATA